MSTNYLFGAGGAVDAIRTADHSARIITPPPIEEEETPPIDDDDDDDRDKRRDPKHKPRNYGITFRNAADMLAELNAIRG